MLSHEVLHLNTGVSLCVSPFSVSMLPGGVYIFCDPCRKLCKEQQARTTVSTFSGANLMGIMNTLNLNLKGDPACSTQPVVEDFVVSPT